MSISHEPITPRPLPGTVISSVDGSELMAEVPPWGFGNAADVQMRHRRRAHTRPNRPRCYAQLGAAQRLDGTGVVHCSVEAEAVARREWAVLSRSRTGNAARGGPGLTSTSGRTVRSIQHGGSRLLCGATRTAL